MVVACVIIVFSECFFLSLSLFLRFVYLFERERARVWRGRGRGERENLEQNPFLRLFLSLDDILPQIRWPCKN